MSLHVAQIIEALNHSADCSITVLGDYCLDKYLYIDPARDELSVETDLIAYQVDRKALFAGVGGTISNNLCALGARVYCIGLVGDDGEGYELLSALKKTGADTHLMVVDKELCTSAYIKPMRLSGDNRYTEMNRFDYRNFTETPKAVEDAVLTNLKEALKISRAVIVTDQFLEKNYSIVTERVRNEIARIAAEHSDKIFYADSRGFIDEYRNIIVKCNHLEVVKAMMPDYKGEITAELVTECGHRLSARNKSAVYITLGAEGSMAFEDGKVSKSPAFRVEDPIDIVGAGDATNAGIVLGLALGLNKEQAALVGNCVSSVTIRQIGVTGTATVAQVQACLSSLL